MQAYVLDNLQLPNIATSTEYVVKSIRKGHSTRTEFLMIPIYNEQFVQYFSIKQRNCRFTHEADKDSMFQIYSRDSCAIEVKLLMNIIYIYIYFFIFFVFLLIDIYTRND